MIKMENTSLDMNSISKYLSLKSINLKYELFSLWWMKFDFLNIEMVIWIIITVQMIVTEVIEKIDTIL